MRPEIAEWRDKAVLFIASWLPRAGGPFSTNDLWAAGLPEPEDARWVNGAMKAAERKGLIRKTGRRVKSKRGGGLTIVEWERRPLAA
jgi:hypothetical protein